MSTPQGERVFNGEKQRAGRAVIKFPTLYIPSAEEAQAIRARLDLLSAASVKLHVDVEELPEAAAQLQAEVEVLRKRFLKP